MTPKPNDKAWPPRVWIVDRPQLGFIAHKERWNSSYGEPQEYLSLSEATALADRRCAEVWEEAALLLPFTLKGERLADRFTAKAQQLRLADRFTAKAKELRSKHVL